MADHDDELREAVRELTRTIEDLQRELESTDRRSRFRPPTPRPPTPRELLRFADEVAIPATVAVLETSVRALKGFQRALELARTEREVRDRAGDAGSATRERATDLRRTTLSQLDTVLAQLQRAASEGALPSDDRAGELLSEARKLRDDVDNRLQDVGEEIDRGQATSTDSIRIDIQEGRPEDVDDGDPTDREDPSRVDVDAELETLKDQYGNDEDAGDTDANEDHSDGAADGTESDGDDADDDDTGADDTDTDDTDDDDTGADDEPGADGEDGENGA